MDLQWLRGFWLIVTLLSGSGSLLAQASLGIFQNWQAESTLVDGQNVCFIWSFPVDREHNARPRGLTQFLITHWPEAERYNDAAIYAGYTYQSESEVQVSIGESTFTFVTNGKWSHVQPQDSSRFAQAFRQGHQMVVQGISDRGTHTTDTYSLISSAGAMDAVDQACAVDQSESPQTTLGMFGSWQAEVAEIDGQTACFIWSFPAAREHNNRPRGLTQFLITHWPGLDMYNDVRIYAGYTHQSESEVRVMIGESIFVFVTRGEWSHAQPQDREELVQVLRRGHQMVVDGLSNRGTHTTDTYSLLGSIRALESIDRECNTSEDEMPNSSDR